MTRSRIPLTLLLALALVPAAAFAAPRGDVDGDGVPDEVDLCPLDPARSVPDVCGCQDAPRRVVALGDSIAIGYPVAGGWRRVLWIEREARGEPIDFVGTESTNAHPVLADPQHEGHSGQRIDQLRAALPSWQAAWGAAVDVVLVMAGTNDILHDQDLAQAPQRMLDLLTTIAQLEPGAQIVVGTIPPFSDPVDDAEAAAFNAALLAPGSGTIALAQLQGIDVVAVDTAALLDPALHLADGVHPNLAGHELIGASWTWRESELPRAYCFGDGGDGMGCTICPCGNVVPDGFRSGCTHSGGRGAVLVARGTASASANSLELEVHGGPANSFAILFSGTTRLPQSGPCPAGRGVAGTVFDGLRCVGGTLERHGTRALGASGGNALPWSGAGGLAAGSMRHYQVFLRDTAGPCNRGQTTSNALTVVTCP